MTRRVARPRTAFIDSGAFIAFLVRHDRRHGETRALFARPPKRLYTSALVVAETYGWFVHRAGEEAARAFRLLLQELPNLRVLAADAGHLAAVWSKLDALRGTKLTLVDASSLVWLGEREIDVVWGTDRHLGIEGTRVVPGVPVS